MKKLSRYVILIFLTSACYQSGNADLILHNAKIYACDENFSTYSAMAVKDGKILALGPEREILNGYTCDNVIDLEQKSVFPGFHDGHCHFLGYAKTKNQVDLVGASSFSEVIERITEFHEKNPSNFITGRGWDQTLWPENEFPNNSELNELFPNVPILIRRIDGHAALANQKALDMAGITIETTVDGGIIEVKNGGLTGLLIDNAYDLVAAAIPELDKQNYLSLLKAAQKDFFEVGLTSLNDAGINAEERDLFLDAYANNELIIRNYAMLFPEEDNLDWAADSGDYRINNLHIRSFKILADGALGSRGACLLHPYADDPDNSGYLLQNPELMQEICELALSIGYQVNTHCIGDKANRTLLEIYAAVLAGIPDHRWKIEHAQVIDPEDFNYFKDYTIIPSVQPTHCTSDMRWAEERLGNERMKGAYAYKTLLEQCGKIILGTDFPIEGINPIETFYAAITRKDREGKPENGFYANQQLTRKEALLGMTIWPAFGNFENHEKGSLEKGKFADFVILTQDIMTISEEEILNTFVEYTYLNGELVYSAY